MITYWGIDGCKGGWIAIGLSQKGETFEAVYIPTIADFWQEHGHLAKAVLIDMPIGLADDEKGRLAEKSASNNDGHPFLLCQLVQLLPMVQHMASPQKITLSLVR